MKIKDWYIEASDFIMGILCLLCLFDLYLCAAAVDMASSSSFNPPCAACKFLRRKCMPGCIFAPYFPPEDPQKFANVHKIFGASNVTKLLNEIYPHQREDAVNSLAYEAEARIKDPVYGCVGVISVLQRQVQRLQKELDAANTDLLRYACHEISSAGMAPVPPLPAAVAASMVPRQRVELGRRNESGEDPFYEGSDLLFSCPPWSNNPPRDMDERHGGENSM